MCSEMHGGKIRIKKGNMKDKKNKYTYKCIHFKMRKCIVARWVGGLCNVSISKKTIISLQ